MAQPITNQNIGIDAYRRPTRTAQQATGFTNIGRVLQAQQPTQFGKQVSTRIGQQLGSAQQRLGEVQGQFNTEAEKARASIGQLTAPLKGAVSTIKAETDPTKIGEAVTDAQTSAYQKLAQLQGANKVYSGPAQMEIGSLYQQAQAANPEEAIRQLAVQRPYTAGQSILDRLLLARSGQSPDLLAAQRQAKRVQGEIGSAEKRSVGKAALEQSLAEEDIKDLQAQIEAAVGSQEAGKETGVLGDVAARQKAYQDLYTKLSAVTPAGDYLQPGADVELPISATELGYDSGLGEGSVALAGLGLELQKQLPGLLDAGSAGFEQSANAKQRAQYAALQKLRGATPDYFTSEDPEGQAYLNPTKQQALKDIIGAHTLTKDELGKMQSNPYYVRAREAQQTEKENRQLYNAYKNRLATGGSDVHWEEYNNLQDAIGDVQGKMEEAQRQASINEQEFYRTGGPKAGEFFQSGFRNIAGKGPLVSGNV